MDKEDREYYKLLNDSYITHYINDTDNHNLYITFASGKKLTIHNPSELIQTKVRCIYKSTGAKLKKANEVLNNKKEK